jgi:hypothetical protein
MTEHPITPPQDKFDQWEDWILNERENVDVVLECAWKDGFQAGADQQLKLDADQIDQAYQSGADQELEGCCAWILRYFQCQRYDTDRLRAVRRPKPLSLKKQALADLYTIQTHDPYGYQIVDLSNIRRAIEALPND